MRGFTRVIIAGNLVHDPAEKQHNGYTYTQVSVAVNDRRKVRDEWRDLVHYFDVSVFGKTAEAVIKHLRKGAPLLVSGRLVQSRWETENGEKRQRVGIVADEVRFLPRQSAGSSSAVPPGVADAFPGAEAVDEGDIPL